MNEAKFNPEDMPILDLDTSEPSRYEASRFLDSPEVISAYLAESMKAQDPQLLMKALAEVAKAQGVHKVAQEAGVNRESLYKSLKGGEKTRFETVRKVMKALGVELTVQPNRRHAHCGNRKKTCQSESRGSCKAHSSKGTSPRLTLPSSSSELDVFLEKEPRRCSTLV
jgi:probable addiction module antidote protein